MRENGGWLRLYCDILENPKLRRLSESSQLFFIWCLCLHKRGWLVGKTDAEIAYSMRLKLTVVVKRLNEMREAGLLLSDNSPKGWEECQFKSDSSTPRVQNHRKNAGAKRSGNVSETLRVTDGVSGLKRYCNGLDQSRSEKSRAEESDRAPEGDGSGGGSPALPGPVGEAEAVVVKAEKALERLRGMGSPWDRLTVEVMVEQIRGQPEANVARVVERIVNDWNGQPVPANLTPPMIVRRCMTWDVQDGMKSATKNAPRDKVLTPEAARARRMGFEV